MYPNRLLVLGKWGNIHVRHLTIATTEYHCKTLHSSNHTP